MALVASHNLGQQADTPGQWTMPNGVYALGFRSVRKGKLHWSVLAKKAKYELKGNGYGISSMGPYGKCSIGSSSFRIIKLFSDLENTDSVILRQMERKIL